MAIDQQLKRRLKPSFRHFHQPAHFVDEIRVKILEKVYSSDKPALSTSPHGTRELHWIKEVGTVKPYGFNDQMKGVDTLRVGTLNSTSCKKNKHLCAVQ